MLITTEAGFQKRAPSNNDSKCMLKAASLHMYMYSFITVLCSHCMDL